MKPTRFKIEVDGQNITQKIIDRLISLSITDVKGLDSDKIMIKLDDREPQFELPPVDVKMHVWLSLKGENLESFGVFTVDEIMTDDEYGTLELSGCAADMLSELKTPRNETYDNLTLDNLVQMVANRAGYQTAVSNELKTINFEHIDQRSESDINLLTRLLRPLNATLKAVEGYLLVQYKNQGESTTGKTLLVHEIDSKKEGVFVRAMITSRSKYTAVKAFYKTVDMTRRKSVSAGEDDKAYELKETYKTQAEAQQHAEAKLKELKQGEKVVEIVMPAHHQIRAEHTVKLLNHRHAGKYSVNESRLTMGDNQILSNYLKLEIKEN